MTHSWDPADVLAEDLTGIWDIATFADGDIPVWDEATSAFVPGTGGGAAGRWEVVVSGVPAEAVTNEAGDDWLYTLVGE